MTVAIACIGLLGLLLFGLGLAVSLTRGRTDTAAGYSSDPSDRLHKLVRAHGNTTEYAAILAVLMLVAGILLSATLDKAHPLRFIGALGTYVAGIGLSTAVLRSL